MKGGYQWPGRIFRDGITGGQLYGQLYLIFSFVIFPRIFHPSIVFPTWLCCACLYCLCNCVTFVNGMSFVSIKYTTDTIIKHILGRVDSVSGKNKWIKMSTYILIFLQLQSHFSQFSLKLLPPECLMILMSAEGLSWTSQLCVGPWWWWWGQWVFCPFYCIMSEMFRDVMGATA